MADIHYVSPNRKHSSGSFAYRLADRTFSADVAFPELITFRSSRAPAPSKNPVPGHLSRSADSKLIFHGPGRVDRQDTEVQCFRHPDGYQLAVDGAAAFGINSRGSQIILYEKTPRGSTGVLNEVVLGPALTLALALQGTWCLHASAVILGQQIVCFLGRSGSGKSTLAAFLDSSESPWRRVADDVLPVKLERDWVNVLPHFPQLKLPAERQPSTGMPERAPLSAIYLIACSNKAGRGAEVRSLTAQEGALALAGLTVAARIFDPDLLARHLAFCTKAIAHISVRELIYPRTFDMLPKVESLLVTDLESQNITSSGRRHDG